MMQWLGSMNYICRLKIFLNRSKFIGSNVVGLIGSLEEIETQTSFIEQQMDGAQFFLLSA